MAITTAQVDGFESAFNKFAGANFQFRKAQMALKEQLTADESLRLNDYLMAVRTEQHSRPKYAESAIAKDPKTQEVIRLALAAQQEKKAFRDLFSDITGDNSKFPKGADAVIGQVDEISVGGKQATTGDIKLSSGDLKSVIVELRSNATGVSSVSASAASSSAATVAPAASASSSRSIDAGKAITKEKIGAVEETFAAFSEARFKFTKAYNSYVEAGGQAVVLNDYYKKGLTHNSPEVPTNVREAYTAYIAARESEAVFIQARKQAGAKDATTLDIINQVKKADKVLSAHEVSYTDANDGQRYTLRQLLDSQTKQMEASTAPTPAPALAPATTDGVIDVKNGDSLSKIANDERLKDARAKVKAALGDKADDLTVTLVLSMAMAEANGIKKPNHIEPGWKIDVAKTVAKIDEVAGKMKLNPIMKDEATLGQITPQEFRSAMQGTTQEILNAR